MGRGQPLNAPCCVVGGGPAGMMVAFLLARAGVDVVVLEKHADFFRDFRGDTIHPSTLEIMHELGLLEAFLKQPHQEVRQLMAHIGPAMVTVADFTHLPTHCKFLAVMPQWDFLNFVAGQAKRYPTFHLTMEADVIDLLVERQRVTGVRARTPSGLLEVHADLVIGADGRHSTVRRQAGLETMELGAPMDVLWMRLSRRSGDPTQVLFRIAFGKMFIMLDRGDYWQCGFIIRKGSFGDIQRRGWAAFRSDIAMLAPFTSDRLEELHDWNEIKLLTVAVDRLRQWYRPGLLCIGDAAHAMSPIGGVGINLAIQDAVAAANILAPPVRGSPIDTERLPDVQRRRELPTRITQRAQVFIQNRLVEPILRSSHRTSLPWPLRLLGWWPLLRRIPARFIGIGFRPEHVRTPDVGLAE